MASSAVCTTPGCLAAATQLLSYMSPNWEKLDPCTDFDKMVCERFSDSNPPEVGTMDLVGAANSEVIHKLLEGTYQEAVNFGGIDENRKIFPSNAVDEANFKKLQQDYKTCMDVEAIKIAGTKPLLDLLVSLNSIWPINAKDATTKMSKDDYDGLSKALFFLEELGIETLQHLEVDNFPLDNNQMAIWIKEPQKFRSENASVYADIESLTAFAVTTAETIIKGPFPGNLSAEEAGAVAAAAALFEADMVKAKTVAMANNTGPYDFRKAGAVKIADLSNWYGLDKAITALLPANYPTDKAIWVNPKDYFTNLTEIIASHPKVAVQGYLLLRALDALQGSITTEPSSRSEGRWKTCLEYLDTSQKFTVGRFFVGATYSETLRQYVDKMAANILVEMKESLLPSLPWLQPEEKARAVKKVDDIVVNVGYPASLSPSSSSANVNGTTSFLDTRNPESLAAYYRDLNITSTSSFFSNVLSARRHNLYQTFSLVLRPADRHLLGAGRYPPQFVNAAFNSADNTMHLFSSLTQSPNLSQDLPGYAAYGGYGSTIGHELFHGFDTNGRLVDESHAFTSWWSEGTVAEYSRRAECFVKQYDGYTYPVPGPDSVPGNSSSGSFGNSTGNSNSNSNSTNTSTAKVNGAATLAENLSDAGGVRVAYETWRRTQSVTKDANLPGLEKFTHAQLFFMFYAKTWCDSYSPERNAMTAPLDNHAVGAWRIKGVLANSRAFREVWGCKAEPVCELY